MYWNHSGGQQLIILWLKSEMIKLFNFILFLAIVNSFVLTDYDFVICMNLFSTDNSASIQVFLNK